MPARSAPTGVGRRYCRARRVRRDRSARTALTELVTEGFRIVAAISRETPQVADVASGDLRADLRIVFLRGGRVDVGDVQRFDIHERGDFQRPDAVMRAGGVVTAGLVAVEASRIDRCVASAFLDRRVEERTPRLRRNSCKSRTENRVVRQPREADLVEDAGHLAEQIHRNAVGFARLDAKRMQREHRPFGEPATPFGVGGFVGVSDNRGLK
jgi:hypothetical protein